MRIVYSAIAFFALSVGVSAQQQPPSSHFDGKTWWEHVKYLADDSLEGRDTGSEGIKKAEAYAVEQFQEGWDLRPRDRMDFIRAVASRNFRWTKRNRRWQLSRMGSWNQSPLPKKDF